MGPTMINGLPAHVLILHFVVVAVPLAAIALVVCVVSTTWLRRLGVVLPLFALLTLITVPITTHAGEWLQDRVADTPLVVKHTNLGDTLLPWVAALFAVTVVVWWFGRRAMLKSAAEVRTGGHGGRPPVRGSIALGTPVRTVAIVLSVVVAAGSIVTLVRIGDSGAKAAWTGQFSEKPVSQGSADR
ncbi:DUF2231 domain-containing protein [Streptomyces sp. 150FB]|uniref:DUF2231 domain-containing protein n=1 Tax=Streptomyces sp. 150FB TaxID=1576605 RepID=UPI000AE1DF1D|nr:DUF2231 domain-containing protein [Streptomyces sp. 150FB]